MQLFIPDEASGMEDESGLWAKSSGREGARRSLPPSLLGAAEFVDKSRLKMECECSR